MRTKMTLGTIVAAMVFGTSLAYAAPTPTWTYDADSNAFPNAAGQPMEGAATSGQTGTNNSLVDIGGGDIVLQSAPISGTAFYQLNGNTNPGTEWDVSSATGFSVEWRVRVFEDTAIGSVAIHAGDGATRGYLRLYRTAGSDQDLIARLIDTGSGNFVEYNLEDNGLDSDAFHTFRMDTIDVASVPTASLTINNGASPVASIALTAFAADYINLGGRSNQTGTSQTQFLKTYQSGVVPEPASILLLIGGATGLMLRRRTTV